MKKKQKKKKGWNWKFPAIVGGVFLTMVILTTITVIFFGNGGSFKNLQTSLVVYNHSQIGSFSACEDDNGIFYDNLLGHRINCEAGDVRPVYDNSNGGIHQDMQSDEYWGYAGDILTCPSCAPKVCKNGSTPKPSGGIVCPGDQDGLTNNTDWKKVDSCTSARKCEYTILQAPPEVDESVNGECGSAADGSRTYTVAPVTGLCAKGISTAIVTPKIGADQAKIWFWHCNGSSGGGNSEKCEARGVVPINSIDGKCGIVNHSCEQGTMRDMAGQPVPGGAGPGVIFWVCEGIDGGKDSDYCSESEGYCGDGVFDENHEQCDTGDQNGIIPTVGYGEVFAYCSDNCEVVEGSGPYCGDGTFDGVHGEECDAGDQNGIIPQDVINGAGDGYCSSECKSMTYLTCGDGTVNQDNEQCDAGDQNGIIPIAAYNTTSPYCKEDCTDGQVAGPRCGDGNIDTSDGEECDDSNRIDGDGCSISCQFESAGVKLIKTASETTIKEGEIVTYSYKVTGTTAPKLIDIKLTDDKLGTISCPEDELDNGESMTCTKSATLTKNTTNKATVTGKSSISGEVVTVSSSATVSVEEEEEEEKEEEEEAEEDPSCESSIGNYIWYDTNGNGIQEDIEEGIDNIEVCAYRGNKKFCDETNKNGRYEIEDLCEGSYDVKVKDVGSMTQTYDPDGTKDDETEVDLGIRDKHTKADFGYRGSAPKTGLATNIALLIGLSTLVTVGVLMMMKKSGSL